MDKKQELTQRINDALARGRKIELAQQINVKSGNPYRQGGGKFAPKTGGTSVSAPVKPTTKSAAGLLQEGNIDIHNRPVVLNPEDGTISTVRSITVTDDAGRAYVIPTVSPDGKILSDNDAINLFRKTGQHLGIFDNEGDAVNYAKKLHQGQEKEYAKKATENIKKFQQDLVKKGAKIKVDGIWGPKTQAAYSKYGKTPEKSAPPEKPKTVSHGANKKSLPT